MKTFSNTSSILIKVNGEDKFIPQNSSILRLLELFQITKGRVVIELNTKIIKKERFASTILNNNDSLEIVTFVGGG